MKWRSPLLFAIPIIASRLGAANDVLIPNASTALGQSVGNAPSGVGPYTMLVAIVCAVVGGWLFWRNRRRADGHILKGKLSIAETRSLGNRQYLVVAAYGEKRYLIGVCVGRISLLAPLDDGAPPASS